MPLLRHCELAILQWKRAKTQLKLPVGTLLGIVCDGSPLATGAGPVDAFLPVGKTVTRGVFDAATGLWLAPASVAKYSRSKFR